MRRSHQRNGCPVIDVRVLRQSERDPVKPLEDLRLPRRTPPGEDELKIGDGLWRAFCQHQNGRHQWFDGREVPQRAGIHQTKRTWGGAASDIRGRKILRVEAVVDAGEARVAPDASANSPQRAFAVLRRRHNRGGAAQDPALHRVLQSLCDPAKLSVFEIRVADRPLIPVVHDQRHSGPAAQRLADQEGRERRPRRHNRGMGHLSQQSQPLPDGAAVPEYLGIGLQHGVGQASRHRPGHRRGPQRKSA